MDKAIDRLDYIKEKEINDKTAKFILEDSYEAVRESAQSLMSINGFKPYSHEATISFIREFHSASFSEDEIHKFDHFRRLRNDSVYKAINIIENDAKSSMFFARLFVKKIKELFEKEK